MYIRALTATLLVLWTSQVSANVMPSDLPLTIEQQIGLTIECLERANLAAAEGCSEEVQRRSPNWDIHAETDPITDEVTLILMRPANAGSMLNGTAPKLTVSCVGRMLLLSVDGKFQPKLSDMISRIDKASPITTVWMPRSGNRYVSDDPGEVYRLLGASELALRFSTLDRGEVTAVFDVSGFDDAAKWLEEYCDGYQPPN